MKLVVYNRNGKRFVALGEFDKWGVFSGYDELSRGVRLRGEVEYVAGDVRDSINLKEVRGMITDEDVKELWEIGEDMDMDTAVYLLGRIGSEYKAALYLQVAETFYFKLRNGKLVRRSENEIQSLVKQRESAKIGHGLVKELKRVLEGGKSDVVDKVLEIYNHGSGDKNVENAIKEIPNFWARFLNTNLVGPENIPFEIRELMTENPGKFEGMELPFADLTHLSTFSIDDEETEDIDDAISLEGDTLYIHIALPYHVSRRGSEADRESLQRGATLYLPDGKWNMYPDEAVKMLSLLEGEERITLTLQVNLKESLDSYRFFVAKVTNKHRLNYRNAENVLKNLGIWEKLYEFVEYLGNLRVKRGGFIMENFFLKVKFDGEISVRVYPPNNASRLVTELMILYNHLAGRYLIRHGLPGIFRIQEEPVSGEVPSINDPLYFPKVKSLAKPVKSSTKPGPHRTSGVDCYVRATSPIRRYSDVLNQHQLLAALNLIEPLDEHTLEHEMQVALSGENKRHRAQKFRTEFLILHKILREDNVKGIAYSEKSAFLPDYLFIDTKSTLPLEVGREYIFKVVRVDFASQKVMISPLE